MSIVNSCPERAVDRQGAGVNHYRGAIACGHPEVAKAAENVLRSGGNAFDAVVAAEFSACVVEPVLSSLGGGGYLLAHPAGARPRVYDFFVQTPHHRKSDVGDFYPIEADFGDVTQEFHIGVGTAATPGTVKGAYAIHRDLGSLPMAELVAPAIQQASEGVDVTPMQGYIFDVVAPIYQATAEARRHFEGSDGKLPGAGTRFRRPALAATLEALVGEGDALFYQGDIAERIADVTGGHLDLDDLRNYQVIVREPLRYQYRSAEVLTNPPPSFGGILIAFGHELLAASTLDSFGSRQHLARLNQAMVLTQKARVDRVVGGEINGDLLNPEYIMRYRKDVLAHAAAMRGTTHISIVDGAGNVAAMTLSNGEGCGVMVPDAGFMLNNMLGEQDINPDGFGLWRENQRMASMMAPSVVSWDGRRVALGSGGSNRIRSAITQVICNLEDFAMPLDEAVAHPRIHNEDGVLSVEPGFEHATLDWLATEVHRIERWQERNLFFGGVHAVEAAGDSLSVMGDSRRGGVGRLVGRSSPSVA